jgi:predicted dehydrogenase
MSDRKVGIVIWGAGRWGSHLIRIFSQHPQATLLAIADPHVERLQAIAEKYAISPDQIALTSDWRSTLSLSGVEAIAIATPAATHAHLIQVALEHDYHVFAEKPLTLDRQEAIALCQLAEQRRCQLFVDHTYLFHPAVQQGRVILQQQLLGELRYGYTVRTHLGPIRSDVDALWDLAIHDISILNHWLAATPIAVQADAIGWLQPEPRPQFPQGLADAVWITLTYPDHLQIRLHLSWCNPDKQRRLCLVGTQGALVFDELAETSLLIQRGGVMVSDRCYIPINQQQQQIAVESIEPLQQVCQHFLNCVQHNQSSSLSCGWVGAQLVQILTAVSQSIAQGGQPVQLSRFQHGRGSRGEIPVHLFPDPTD